MPRPTIDLLEVYRVKGIHGHGVAEGDISETCPRGSISATHCGDKLASTLFRLANRGSMRFVGWLQNPSQELQTEPRAQR